MLSIFVSVGPLWIVVLARRRIAGAPRAALLSKSEFHASRNRRFWIANRVRRPQLAVQLNEGTTR